MENLINSPEFKIAKSVCADYAKQVERERYNRKYKHDERVKEMALTGVYSEDEIASEIGITKKTVQNALKRQGITLKKRVKPKKKWRSFRKVKIEVSDNDRREYHNIVKCLKKFKGLSQTAAENGVSMHRVKMIAQMEKLPLDYFDLSIEERIDVICRRYLVERPEPVKKEADWTGYIPKKYDELCDKNGMRYVVVGVSEEELRVKKKWKDAMGIAKKEPAEIVSMKMWFSGKCKYKMAETFKGNLG